MPQPAYLQPEPEPALPASSLPRDSRAMHRTREVLHMVFGPPLERSFDIHLWDGGVDEGRRLPKADWSLHIRRRGALRRMLLPPSELSIAESFVSGDVDILGRLEGAMGLPDAIGARIESVGGIARLLASVVRLPRDDDPGVEASQYTRGGLTLVGAPRRSSEKEIRFHYDVGNDFYSLFLDPEMLYTCAYYRDSTDDLATAQRAKLDHICRKLRLQPGERLLDIGCGWGGLVMHAAQHYGVEALGITLSVAQAELAQQRIAERGLSDQCAVRVMDFRDLHPEMRFHKMTSVGVTEHVPEVEQPAYFARAFAALEPGGLFMNHCETSNITARRRETLGDRIERRLWKRDQFIDRYVFPDARLVALGSIITSAERAGFETRDVESLREHYALTLRAWLRNLERRSADATALVGDRTYRVWRLYMTVAAHAFDTAALNIVQTLLSKPGPTGESGVPLTREDLYLSTPRA